MKKTKLRALPLLAALILILSGCTGPAPVSTGTETAPAESTETQETIPPAKITSPLTRAELERVPVATAEMEEDQLRSICREYMRLMVNVIWTPDQSISYSYPSANASDAAGELHLNFGTRYSGVPYSQAAANLESFLDYYDEETGVLALSRVGDAISEAFGNNCGTSLFWAWQRVSSTIDYYGTRQICKAHGCVPVGKWTYDETLTDFYTVTTREIAQQNGKAVMLASYAALKPGDGMTLTARGTGGSVIGHARMVDEVHVVRDSDGSVNGSESYVYCIEQASSGIDRVTEDGKVEGIGSYRSRYTFNNLYEKGYLPFTVAELCGQSTVQKAAASYKTGDGATAVRAFLAGTIRANYCISRADITFTAGDGSTYSVFREGSCRSTEQYVMKMSDLVSSGLLLRNLKKGESYTVSITVRLGNGETLPLEPFGFLYQP